MVTVEWAVRYRSEHGSHVTAAASESEAHARAAHHATLHGCSAEVLSRRVPDFATARSYRNVWRPKP